MKRFRDCVNRTMGMMAVVMMVASCAEQDGLGNKATQSEGLNTCTMVLKGGLTDYEQTTRSSDGETVWADSSRVYLQFLNGSQRISGSALYDAESQQWTVSYYGSLPEGTSLTCEARYFENIDSTTTAGLVVTNEHTSIYEDLKGSYLYENEELTVVANLTPKTGRIRFVGDKGTKVKLTGITSYSTYEPQSNHFTTTNELIEVTTDASETTPYIYGYFTNDTVRYLGLMANDYAFTKACKEGMMDKGVSGYLSIPTLEKCNGWEKGLRVRVKGVEFLMIPCPDFDTKSSFAIGETEVTQELYSAVMSTTSENPNHPILGAYNTSISFINKLKELTSLSFALPNSKQWIYAAKGGSSSQGYTYSGSNDADAVAWYVDNSTGYHRVKTKQANELGLYDMSGNVSEWVLNSDSYSSYYCYGGSYKQDKKNIYPTSYSYSSYSSSSPSNNAVGFRLAINY